MRIDMHVHTNKSPCAFPTLEKIVKVAKQRKLDGIAITDHNTIAALSEGKRFLKSQKDFDVIWGQELRVYDGGRKAGELLVYFINEAINEGEIGDITDQVKSQGAFTSLPHPFGHYLLDEPKFDCYAGKADAIEVFNGRACLPLSNKKALALAERLKKPVTAGSDAHFACEVGKVYVETSASSLQEFRKKLEKKKVKVVGRIGFPLPLLFASAIKKRVNFIRRF